MEGISTTIVERLDEYSEPLLQAMKGLLKEARDEKAEARAYLDQATEAEKELVRRIRLFEPTFEQDHKPGPKGNGGSQKKYAPSDEKVALVRDWLDEHREELNGNGGFTPGAIMEHADYAIASSSYTSTILRVLHDRGVLVLAGKGRGNSPIYRLP